MAEKKAQVAFFFRLGLLAFLALALPTSSSCGFGFMPTSALMRRFVFSSLVDCLDMSEFPVIPKWLFDPNSYERPFWEPIGKFVFRFGYLERDIDWALSALLQLEYERVGRIVFSQMNSLPAKLKLIGSLTIKLTKDDTLRATVGDLLEKIDTQRAFRNSVVHGAWNNYVVHASDPAGGTWQKVEISNSLKYKAFSVTAKDLEERYEQLFPLGSALTNAIQEIMKSRSASFSPPPSHDKPPPPSDPQ